MANFGNRRVRGFKAATRVIRSGRGVRIGFITPGIKRGRAKKLNGLQGMIKP
jgi:hypothetical protein